MQALPTDATEIPLTRREKLVLKTAAKFSVDPLDFQPGLIRLQGKAPSPLGRMVLWVILGFLALLIIGSIVGKIDIVAVADGKLVPATYLKIVQPADAGVVKEILVAEGESVKKGQTLLRMDAALSDSDIKSLNADYWSRRLAQKRIDAELASAPFVRSSDDPPELFARVLAQYHADRTAYQSAVSEEQATLQKARFDLASAQEVKGKLLQTLPHYREQEKAYAELSKEGFAGKLMYTDKQRERIEKEQDLRAQESAILSAQSTISQSERKIAQITADYRKQLEAERADNTPHLEKAAQDLAKEEHKHEYLELKAPQDGVIKDLATHTIGTVASPGTILMTLVPKDEILKAEVWVKNDDIGFVHTNLPVKVKLAAFTFQKYGMLEGKVVQVSADASDQGGSDQNNPNSNVAAKNKPSAPLAYKAIVELKAQSLAVDGVSYPLSPGMQVSAEVNLGTRTVLEYFLSPVTKAFHEAGRER
jgi:HlyD family secretion protein